jgi:predicted  nucleic acid-binding Zn-ribbon protein
MGWISKDVAGKRGLKIKGRRDIIVLNGTITVYLALILMLILSLVLTVIEGARVSTAKVYAHRALTTAMDSVWAEYYRPLWEEYHIFGYDCGEGSNSDKTERIEEKLGEYMSYTFDPNQNMSSVEQRKGLELYGISIASLSVRELTGLMDFRGELFLHEAVEYMKYNELADGLTLLMDKLSLLETPKKISVIYRDKLAAEQELAKTDIRILRLMELLDGIRTSRNGIRLDRNGKLQIKDRFAKMLCFEAVSMENVSINHEAVFEAVKKHYVNPANIISQIKQDTAELNLNKEHMLSVMNEIRSAADALEAAGNQLQEVRKSASDNKEKNNVPGNSNSPKQDAQQSEAQVQSIQETISSLEEQLSRLHSREQQLRMEKQQLSSSVETRLNYIKDLIQSLIPIIEEACRETKDINRITRAGAVLVKNFEEKLKAEGGGLNDAVYEGLEKSLTDMKRYTSRYQGDNSMSQIHSVLQSNSLCLTRGKDAISRVSGYLGQENYPQAISEADLLLECLQKYDIKSLSLDYSSLTFDRSGEQSPVEQIAGLIKNGITGLVIASEDISEKKLDTRQLPSVEAALQKEGTDFSSMITGFFEDVIQENSENEMGGLFGSFDNTVKLDALIMESINGMAEHLLFQEYLREHFASYQPENTRLSAGKPSALNYELEYLLAGGSSDRENLASALSRIIFLRTILDFVTLLGDRTRCEEAKLAAAAVVGFTGLPMLINIMQVIIMLAWSFAEALTDTCALLLGKEVPILKQTLVLKLPEILMINPSFLKAKAAAYPETGRLAFSYVDYLRGFILMKEKEELIYRGMDLIQENLNLRYENVFYMRNCLFGLEAEAEYTVAPRFLALPIMSRYFNKGTAGFHFSGKAGYSY